MLSLRLFLYALSCAIVFQLGMCNEIVQRQLRGDHLPTASDCGGEDLWSEFKRSLFNYSGIIATAFLALTGHFVKSYIDARNLAKLAEIERSNLARLAEIERLGKQIEYFFGPVDGCSRRGSSGFVALINRYRRNFVKKNGGVDSQDDQFYVDSLSEELRCIEESNGEFHNQDLLMMWMTFVKDVAHPVNLEIRDMIAKETLLYDGSYPECFEQIFDVVAEREMMLQQWDGKDYTNLRGQIKFPPLVNSFVRDQLHAKQTRRAALLGLTMATEGGTDGTDGTGGTVVIKRPVHMKYAADARRSEYGYLPLPTGSETGQDGKEI